MTVVNTETGEIVEPLTDDEAARLRVKEHAIERGADQVAQALATIRDERLYRADYPTFEAYCRERWGMSRVTAHRKIVAAEVAALLPIGNNLPEGQARELADLRDDPERLREVYAQAQEATGGNVTAKAIRDIRNPAPEPEPEFVSATEALAALDTQDASPDAEDPAPVEQEPDEAPADVQPEGEGWRCSEPRLRTRERPRPPATVTGIDGKTYLRPVPASRPKPAADEFTDHDRAEELARNLARNLSLLYALTSPERRAEYIATWREGTADLKPLGWDFITPAHMRELSAALLDFASEWEKAHA